MTEPISMENKRKLTKSDIVRGKRDVSWYYIEALDGEVPIRPLTDGEWSKCQAVEVSGITLDGNPQKDADGNPDPNSMRVGFSFSDMQTSSHSAAALACTFAIEFEDGDKLTVNDVDKFPPGATEEIYRKIKEITGVEGMGGLTDMVSNFRSDKRS